MDIDNKMMLGAASMGEIAPKNIVGETGLDYQGSKSKVGGW